ncbi:MAG: hypothetical protein KGD59_04520 [Candidatus Heimdallarchaeota archaeon]|nr:hypothetical protein [Candidatus Heimdallarchaeota archaeon]
MSQIKLPKAELIQGNIDYPEMIKQDFRKALLIIGLTVLSTLVVTTGLFVMAWFIM